MRLAAVSFHGALGLQGGVERDYRLMRSSARRPQILVASELPIPSCSPAKRQRKGMMDGAIDECSDQKNSA